MSTFEVKAILPEEKRNDLQLAMALCKCRFNQQFARLAVEEKIERTLKNGSSKNETSSSADIDN